MLNEIKNLFTSKELLDGNFGVEREGLRADKKGNLSLKVHPKQFGEKIFNPYITTDFSESQMELITPVFNKTDELYNFLNVLYDIAAIELDEEYLWPQSMPCIIPNDKDIPLAKFDNSSMGEEAEKYRKKLLEKYGAKKQLISGIHYNFSFNENLIKKLYKNTSNKLSYKEFKDNIYLKVARNYLRYRWLIVYLLGGTGLIHESYAKECVKRLEEVSSNVFTNEGALSYRNSECGYTNKVDLFADYNSTKDYVDSLRRFIDDGIIDSHKEFYSSIRLKAKDNNNFFSSLTDEGINYLEYRSIDINPFDKAGISLDDLNFLQLFNLFLLIADESDFDSWQQESLENQKKIARYGQNELMLKKDGDLINKEKWALDILEKIQFINEELNLGKKEIIYKMIDRIKDYKCTYSYKILEKVKKEGYIAAHLNLAKKYKDSSYNNRFKLQGYEDLELSTQLLIKESIKRGIEFKLIDRNENFISLKKGNKVEYVKQATKTSKDNYSTVLIMENKIVTKKVLKDHGLRVPGGYEFHTIEEAIENYDRFKNKPIVIKPKTTNFGIGISIFTDEFEKEDIIKAVEIAFRHDNTILVEEFIKGNEYRFLVINDNVAGILHRVPANVIGDGIKSIKELVEIKNTSSLRGRGYKTPLEKINLDETAKLFLKQSNLTFDYIPNKEEIVYLRENSNISTGGDSIDYTDYIKDKYKKIAIDAAKAVGAKICGVDMIIEDYTQDESSYGIIELNFNPAIHIHSYPYKGTERNIAKEILKLLDFIK